MLSKLFTTVAAVAALAWVASAASGAGRDLADSEAAFVTGAAERCETSKQQNVCYNNGQCGGGCGCGTQWVPEGKKDPARNNYVVGSTPCDTNRVCTTPFSTNTLCSP